MTRAKKIRPAGELGGSHGDLSELPQHSLPLQTADPLAQALNEVFVVVVELPNDKLRRRVFLSLHSAQRAAERARAADREARLWLAQLAPVAEVTL